MARALKGLDPEETMVVVVSKTFTTAETMLNARTVRKWLQSHLGEVLSTCMPSGRACQRSPECTQPHIVH